MRKSPDDQAGQTELEAALSKVRPRYERTKWKRLLDPETLETLDRFEEWLPSYGVTSAQPYKSLATKGLARLLAGDDWASLSYRERSALIALKEFTQQQKGKGDE